MSFFTAMEATTWLYKKGKAKGNFSTFCCDIKSLHFRVHIGGVSHHVFTLTYLIISVPHLEKFEHMAASRATVWFLSSWVTPFVFVFGTKWEANSRGCGILQGSIEHEDSSFCHFVGCTFCLLYPYLAFILIFG